MATKVCHWHFMLYTAHRGDDPEDYEQIPRSFMVEYHPECEACVAERRV